LPLGQGLAALTTSCRGYPELFALSILLFLLDPIAIVVAKPKRYNKKQDLAHGKKKGGDKPRPYIS